MSTRQPSQTLQDQSWVLVTGASSGFGEEFARQYAAQGRPLVLVARRIEKLQALATELRETCRVEVIVEQVDLSAITAVVDLHKRLREPRAYSSRAAGISSISCMRPSEAVPMLFSSSYFANRCFRVPPWASYALSLIPTS